MNLGSESSTLPPGWISTNLAQLGEIYCGQSPSVAEVNTEGNGVPYVTGPEQWNGHRIHRNKWTEHPRRIAPEGSIFITVKGAGIGKLFPGMHAAIGRDIYAFEPLDGIDPDYVFYALRHTIDEVVLNGKGDIPGLSKSHILDHSIGLPGAREQRRIVEKIEELFSELDNGVANLHRARQQLQVYQQALHKQAFEGKLTARWREEHRDSLENPARLLDRIGEQRQRRYREALAEWGGQVVYWEARGRLGPKPTRPTKHKRPEPLSLQELEPLPTFPDVWRCVRLAEIAEIGTGMSVSSKRKVEDPVEVPYLRVANVQRGYLNLDEIKTMRIERTQLPRLELAEWDVLFNEGGDRDKLGRGWVWQSQIAPCITQNHVFRASPTLPSEIHAKWISYWGNSFGQRYFDRQGKQTTNLASINKTVLSRFPVPLPSLQEQTEIIQILEARMTVVDRLDQEIDAGLTRLDALRQSILKRAFAGKLVPQNPADEPASVLLERIASERKASSNGRKERKTGT